MEKMYKNVIIAVNLGGRESEIYDSSKHVQVPRRALNCSSSKDIESFFYILQYTGTAEVMGTHFQLLLETLSLENRGHNPQELKNYHYSNP